MSCSETTWNANLAAKVGCAIIWAGTAWIGVQVLVWALDGILQMSKMPGFWLWLPVGVSFVFGFAGSEAIGKSYRNEFSTTVSLLSLLFPVVVLVIQALVAWA